MTQEFKEPAAGDDVQMPLGIGGDAAPMEEYSPPRARVNTSTVALIASFLAALAVLYFMGAQNKPRAAPGADPGIGIRIDKYIGDQDGRQNIKNTSDQLVQKLHEYVDGTRVAAVDPGVNAWIQTTAAPPPPPPPATLPGGGETHVTPPEDPALKEVAKTYYGLKLQLVLLGQPSTAMINNQLASVGTQYGLLTVTDIQNDKVLLTYDGGTGKKVVLPLYINGSSADPNAAFGGSKPK